MKTKLFPFYLLVTIVVILLCYSLFFRIKENKQYFPAPAETVVISEGHESQEEMRRIQWIAQMHRAAPGVNWKAIEQENRWQNYLLRKQNSQNKGALTQLKGTIANGYWRERGSVNLAGRIHVAEYDSVNNLIYCGSAGGTIWRGSFNGTNWMPLNNALQFDGILMIRVIPHGSNQRLLVATGGYPYFYFSDDGGATWNASGGLTGAQYGGRTLVKAVVLDNPQHSIYLLAAEWNSGGLFAQTTIYRSVDSGNTFSQIISYAEATYGSATFDLWAPRHGNISCYLLNLQGLQATLYKLNPSSGQPQTIASFPVSSWGNTLLTGCNTSPPTFYASVNQEIYCSLNGGSTWSHRGTVPQGYFSRNSFSCSITNPSTLFIGGMEAFHSTNGGITWSIVNNWFDYYGDPLTKLHVDIPCIIPFLNGGEQQFIGTDGGLYLSDDALQTVQNISLNGLNVSQYYSTYTDRNDSNFIYAGSQDQGFQRCQTDSGTVLGFSQFISGDYGSIVSANGGNSIWMVYPSFAAYLDNAQTTSNYPVTWNFNGSTQIWLPPLMQDPSGNKDIAYMAGKYLTTSGSHIFRLMANSGIITASEVPYDFSAASSGGYISAMAFSPLNPDYWYVLTNNGHFFYSPDSGNTWNQTASSASPPHYFYGSAIYASHIQSGTIYIGGSGYDTPPAYKSTDNGQTFIPITNGLPNTLVFQITGDDQEKFLFAATEAGPYVYSTAEGTWYNMENNNAPDQVYRSVEFIPQTQTVRFGTYGRGIWDFKIGSSPFGIPDVITNNSTTIFPNPSNGKFKISSNIAISAVDIYNLLGERVYSDYNFNQQSSIDLSGYSSGTYLIKIYCGTKIINRKVVVQ